MELVFYIILILLSSITILLESNFLYRWLFIPSVISFIFIIRFSGFDTDILTYANQMHASSLDLYYLREFIFWFGSRLAYYITQDEVFAMLLMDLIWIIAIIKAGNRLSDYKKEKLNNGLLLVLMTSFPFVFGYENIYRQFYATVFALLSYSLVDKKYYKSIYLFIVAFFMHNIVALLIPIFIIKKIYKFDISSRIQIAIIASLLFVSSLGVLESLKSVEKSGIQMGLFYLIIFIILLVIGLIVFRKNIYVLFEKVPSLFFIVIMMSGLVFLDADMIAERIGMILISFVTYDLYKFTSEIENRGIRSVVRLSLMLIFTIPTLFFESSLKFLM
tara:strand:+ start:1931 stop:2926 length:996 start_codon:yes stop_codon:yes gene_type:complete